MCPEYAGAGFTLKYRNGWLKDLTLGRALSGSIARDQQLGYTRSGSHAADWSFRINDADPIEMFSRGQQKLFSLHYAWCKHVWLRTVIAIEAYCY